VAYQSGNAAKIAPPADGRFDYAISSPSGSWVGIRKVFTSSPQTVIPGNRRNHRTGLRMEAVKIRIGVQ
jgi:hypothetical protein